MVQTIYIGDNNVTSVAKVIFSEQDFVSLVFEHMGGDAGNYLELIGFSDTDTPYILGDVIDRGKYSMRTLLHVMRQPNIKMLLGNHELMMLRSNQDSYFNC